jgi:hypothetical protein
MKKTARGAIALGVTILLVGCVEGRGAVPSGPSGVAVVDQGIEGDTAAGSGTLRRALSEAVDDRTHWDSLHLLVECAADAGMRSVEVHGNGVGIWDHDRQFRLTPAELSRLLRTLDEAEFTSLEEIYGGRERPDPGAPERTEEEGSAIRVVCRVTLSLAGRTKQVVQLAKGEQSAELRRLGEALLALCREAGQAGTAAEDLSDGLEKVSRGDLAPETLRLLLHRKPQTTGSDAAAGGFLLRLSGRRVTSRGYDPAAGLLDPLRLVLSSAEVADLARELAGRGLAELPVNLFAVHYTDLSVEVLDHKTSVQARQFAGMTATTHGERQIDFERVYDALYQLPLRVVSVGEPIGEAGG